MDETKGSAIETIDEIKLRIGQERYVTALAMAFKFNTSNHGCHPSHQALMDLETESRDAFDVVASVAIHGVK